MLIDSGKPSPESINLFIRQFNCFFLMDICLSKNEDLTGILVSLDFRKAFDTLEWPFIKRVLNLFNFGESVKRWISIFYTDVESAVLNNGFATNWFKGS